ncbi:putative glycosyl transferase CAP10 domain-containing protein [Helianthus annuus]|nr:putative glycosyl transferase CAP10 domain-containing protein [Helianthus annuus]
MSTSYSLGFMRLPHYIFVILTGQMYKIYAEGYAWSVSLKYILLCGCVPLIINPKYDDFFSRGLFPKKDYLPISPENICPSIKTAVKWGNAHPAQVSFHISS